MAIEPIFTAAAGWLVSNYGKEVVDSTLGLFNKRLKAEWAKVAWPESAARYEARLREQYGQFKPLGASEPVALADVFTDVNILDKPTVHRKYNLDELQEQFVKRDTLRYGSGQRQNGLEMVRRPESKRLYILGKPGAGKTTFLRYLTLEALEGRLDKAPLFIPLHDWSKSGLELMAYIDREFDICGFPGARPFVEYILQTGRALTLFDGLDEVLPEKQQEIIEAIVEFDRRYPNSQMLITCRLAAGDYRFERFTDVEIADFSEGQIRAFARRWFKGERETAQKFLDELYRPDNAGVRELAAIPLLLTLLCLAFDRNYRLPARRSDLYEDAIEALLRDWDARRRIERPQEIYKNLSFQNKMWFFARLAADAFEAGDYFLPQDRLAGQIVHWLSRLPGEGSDDGLAILKAIAAHHGIFVERAREVYSFAHLSFQEYFTARFFARSGKNLPRLLTPDRVTDSRWREVLLLTAEMVDEADDFFRLFQQALAQLIIPDPALTKLLAWAGNRAEAAFLFYSDSRSLHNPATLRIFHIVLTLAHDPNLALDLDRDRVLDLDRTRTRARALVRALDLALARDLDLDLAHVHDLDLVRALDRDLDLALARAQDLGPGPALDWGLTIARLTGETFQHLHDRKNIQDVAGKLPAYLAGLVELSRPLNDSALTAALAKLAAPPGGAAKNVWAGFNAALSDIMSTHRRLREHQLSKEQAGRLADYLEANSLLLECLEQAVVTDREEIKRGLLLLPEPH